MITSSVTSRLPLVSPTSSAARGTADDAQGQDAINGPSDSSDSPDSSLLASGVPPVIEAGESASAGLESFRTAMLFFVGIATGISAGQTSEGGSEGGSGLAVAITPPFLSAGCNLEKDDGRDAFWQRLSDRFVITQWYKDHVAARLQGTEQSSLRIEPTADNGVGIDTKELDSDKAASTAKLVASQVADGSAIPSAMVNNLDNRVAAALLSDRNF
jgi:hypothetical protein